MAGEIRDSSAYRKAFSGPPSDRQLRAEALKHALDIRKFEIELYWKRAAYFWTLIAAAFGAYFLLKNGALARNAGSVFVVACLGFILSTAWYLTNRGSKYWQENWERHVDTLEDEIVGPLYKTVISREEFPFYFLNGGYPFSVSKVNQLVSLFVTFVWLGLAAHSFPGFALSRWSRLDPYVILAAVTGIFFVCFFKFGGGGSEGKVRNVNFRTSPLGSTHLDNEAT
jgi:hypothetical protein